MTTKAFSLYLQLTAATALLCAASPVWSAADISPATGARIERVLARTPLIDGHNDLPEVLREELGDQASLADFSGRTGTPIAKLQTDIARLRKGHVGGQFWSVWIDVSITGPDAIKKTLEQIDFVRTMVARNPESFAMASTADDVVRIHKSGRIASMIGVEGGHQIGESMAALRQYYALGARYMTLTHSRNNALADAATENPVFNGLSPIGRSVVTEMNRIGMLIDLAHVSPDAMRQAITLSKAPVIFSHSGARAVTEHPRNVPDDVLKMLVEHDGVVMVNFYSAYINNAYNHWKADEAAEIARTNAPPFGGLYIGQPEKAKAALDVWRVAHPRPVATIKDVADHLDHIVKVSGIDHVGIGSDFDGVSGETPVGLASVADYPNLFADLIKRGWTDDMLGKLAGGNVLRVMRKAEAVAASMKDAPIGTQSTPTSPPRHGG
jgi:membrane dipeptidase